MELFLDAAKWSIVAILSLIYVAAATRLISAAWFEAKLRYHKRVLAHMEGEIKWSTVEPGNH